MNASVNGAMEEYSNNPAMAEIGIPDSRSSFIAIVRRTSSRTSENEVPSTASSRLSFFGLTLRVVAMKSLVHQPEPMTLCMTAATMVAIVWS